MQLIATDRRTSLWAALMVLLCAAIVAAAGIPDVADAKKKNRRVGSYVGVTDDAGHLGRPGGQVSFRFTKRRKIVGFTATNVPRYCRFSMGGDYQPFGITTASAPTMIVEGVARFFFSNRGTVANHPPISIEVNGKPNGVSRTGLKGYVYQDDETVPGTFTDMFNGTPGCTTYKADWTAHKVKRR